MPDGVIQLKRGAQQVEHLRFGMRAKAEVLGHRVGEHVLVARELRPQRLELRAALVGARVGLLLEGFLLRREEPLHTLDLGSRKLHFVGHVIHFCLLL